jgi:hypothetical protein
MTTFAPELSTPSRPTPDSTVYRSRAAPRPQAGQACDAAAGALSVPTAPVGDEDGGPRGATNLDSARDTGLSNDESDLALNLAACSAGRGLTVHTAQSEARAHAAISSWR